MSVTWNNNSAQKNYNVQAEGSGQAGEAFVVTFWRFKNITLPAN